LNTVSHPQHIPMLTRVLFPLRTLYCMLVLEKLFFWSFKQGKNPSADMEGPLFISGSPVREVELGRAALASPELMNKYGVYLFTGTVKNKAGEPIPNATVDIWQADSEGSYYFATWQLRGKVHTDAQGRFEVITVPPGAYAGRAGHFHLIIHPTKSEASKYEPLTSQAYVSMTNDPKAMNSDIANIFRKARHHNMMRSWGIPQRAVKKFSAFPASASMDDATRASVDKWNAQLERDGKSDLKVCAGGHLDFTLFEKKKGWLW